MDGAKLNEALDTIACIRSSECLKRAVSHLRVMFGVSHLVYCGMRMPGLERTDPYLVLTYPDEWIRRYYEENYFEIDPVHQAGRRSLLPIDWTTLDISSSDVRHFFADADSHGIGRQGMSFPMRGPDGDVGVFSFTSHVRADDWPAFRNKVRADLAFVGLFFHESVVRTWAAERGTRVRPTLTVRERECLQFLAEGVPPKQIALDLDLSEAAVRLYLKRARARLGASSTMQAAILALRADLIAVR